jgi:hypothetical protein
MLAPAVALCAATAVAVSPLGLPAFATPGHTTNAAAPVVSPLVLTAPKTVTAYVYHKRAHFDPGLRVTARGESFELWSNRASYDEPITTVWRRPSGDVALPEGTMTDFSELPGLIRLTYANAGGDLLRQNTYGVCLNGWSERVTPEAEVRSPYPFGCPYNKFSTGSVVGIQSGWATRLDMYDTAVRLAPGRYHVTATIPWSYRKLFHITFADGSRTFTLVVPAKSEEGRRSDRPVLPMRERLVPAAHEPTSAGGRIPTGPKPDLRSLPAFGIRISKDGNYLQFSGTVWNAGDSPLVVDGFRRSGEDLMDAYQYFLDADGHQTGYQRIGELEWDARATHQHWHFRDFARYRLLESDLSPAVRSRKEAFCLANTDAVDYTVPGADWQPFGTDLQTSCGDYDSLSVREVLSAGSGDTYAQFRAGQSFALSGLPNGRYYISVEANPTRRLIESSTANNVALRTVIIGGTPGARTVRALPVGLVH